MAGISLFQYLWLLQPWVLSQVFSIRHEFPPVDWAFSPISWLLFYPQDRSCGVLPGSWVLWFTGLPLGGTVGDSSPMLQYSENKSSVRSLPAPVRTSLIPQVLWQNMKLLTFKLRRHSWAVVQAYIVLGVFWTFLINDQKEVSSA